MKRVLFIDDKTIRKDTDVEYNGDPKLISNSIWRNQTLYVKEAMDTCAKGLYDIVVDEVAKFLAGDGYVIPQKYKDLLDDAIQPYLAHLVTNDYALRAQFRLSNKGVQKLSDATAPSIGTDELEYLRTQLKNETAAYKRALVDYIKDNNLAPNPTGCCGGIGNTGISDSIGWKLWCIVAILLLGSCKVRKQYETTERVQYTQSTAVIEKTVDSTISEKAETVEVNDWKNVHWEKVVTHYKIDSTRSTKDTTITYVSTQERYTMTDTSRIERKQVVQKIQRSTRVADRAQKDSSTYTDEATGKKITLHQGFTAGDIWLFAVIAGLLLLLVIVFGKRAKNE